MNSRYSPITLPSVAANEMSVGNPDKSIVNWVRSAAILLPLWSHGKVINSFVLDGNGDAADALAGMRYHSRPSVRAAPAPMQAQGACRRHRDVTQGAVWRAACSPAIVGRAPATGPRVLPLALPLADAALQRKNSM